MHKISVRSHYQDCAMTLHDLRNPSSKISIENLRQYFARIASNACNDVLRTKSPARARLKNNLRFILSHHRDFAVWKTEVDTTNQVKRGAITVLSEYRQQRRRKDGHKLVTKEKRQALQPAASH